MATEDATTPLLDSYPPSSHTRILPTRYTPIEVVVVLYFLSISCLFPVQQYYVISVVAKEYNESGFINHGAADCKKNVTHRTETKSVGDIIDEKSTEILMYLGFCSTFLSVAPIIFLGSVADRLGRKSVICFCLSGLVLKEIVNIIVIHFQLSLNFLFVGQVIEGLTGSFGALMMVLFGMTADITSPGKNRALRISVVEGIAAITYSIGTLGIGYWIRYGGFYSPMLFIITLTILCILFCVLFIPETSQFRNSGDTFFSTTYLLRSFRLYTDKFPSGRHWKLLTGLFILAMSGAAILGRSGTVTLYLMRHPFCWNAVKVQVFSSIQTFVNWGAVIVVVRVLHVFMQDYGILVIGSISATLAFLFLSLATHDWMVYMFVVVGICSSSVFPVIRAFMSRQCKPEDQGSLFASISGTELLFTAFSQLLYGGVYKASVSFYPGLVFLIMTGVLFIVVIVSILNYRWMKRDDNLTQTWETIN